MARMRIVGSVVVVLSASILLADDEESKLPQAGKEHEFLKRFVGEWACDGKAFLEPGKPPTESKSSMKGHMIGDFWAIIVVHADAGGVPYHGQGTFGYDSQNKNKYIGTWADSMSEFLWKYEGTADGNKLVLESEGPSPIEPGKFVKARDTWEFKDKDLIILSSQMEGPDGTMTTVMTATCRRK